MINEYRAKILADIAANPGEDLFTSMLSVFDGEIEAGLSFEAAKCAAEAWLYNDIDDEAYDCGQEIET